MYILFNKDTKRVIDMNNKPFVSYTSNLELAEYNGEIPKHDYLTVTNERQETKTFVEKKIVLKTVIKKEPQVQAKLVYEEIEVKDENGQVVLDEDGNKVLTAIPKWVEETIEVDVEKEVEEEVEEIKTRTYLTCNLVANFYPPKTEEELAKEKEKKYKDLCEKYIRAKYSVGDEFQILREHDANPEDCVVIKNFNEYNAYVKNCLLRAELETK
jgi:hypothetical protein